MKSKFNIIRVIMIFFLFISSPVLPYGAIFGTTLNLDDKLPWSILFALIILSTLLVIWDLFLNKLVIVYLKDQELLFKNLITRKLHKFHISEIEEIKTSNWKGTTTFISGENKITIRNDVYTNIDTLLREIRCNVQSSPK
ncbi:MAG: hypothetical protein JXQ87_02540 [Bacteroidia bacterium]